MEDRRLALELPPGASLSGTNWSICSNSLGLADNGKTCAWIEQSEEMVEEASPCEGEDCGESDVARELSQQDD